MSYANQIVEGFLDKIQDVGLIAMLNLLMNNAHPIVKIIKQIQDAKTFVRTIQMIQPVKGWSYLDNLGYLNQAQQLPQQQQQYQEQQQDQEDHKHQEQEEKNQLIKSRLKKKEIMITTIMVTMIIITAVPPDTTHFTVSTTTLVMVEEIEMERRELEEALILTKSKFVRQKTQLEVRD